jgi:DNA gyrase subunit A
VRRNRLSDFRNVRASGLIAMKLEERDSLIGVATCREGEDVMLATRLGRCIRFQAEPDTLRLFAGRDSDGVRGIRLMEGDSVIALSVLRHVEASAAERAAYLKAAAAKRRAGEEEAEAPAAADDAEEPVAEIALSAERFAELEAAEEIILAVTDGGFGKRTSAHDYRVTGRGGQGVTGITLSARTGREVVATFPVRPGDHLMLVTDGGQLIRIEADDVRLTGRQGMGVTLMRLSDGERVISCFPVADEGEDEDAGQADG